MSKYDIMTVCKVRYNLGLKCSDCIYEGYECESVKKRFKVDRPNDYLERKGELYYGYQEDTEE